LFSVPVEKLPDRAPDAEFEPPKNENDHADDLDDRRPLLTRRRGECRQPRLLVVREPGNDGSLAVCGDITDVLP
jgi:hypothetical protein